MAARTGTTSPATLYSAPPVPPRMPAGVASKPAPGPEPAPPLLDMGPPLPPDHALPGPPAPREVTLASAGVLPLAPVVAERSDEAAEVPRFRPAPVVASSEVEAQQRVAKAAGPVTVPGVKAAGAGGGAGAGRRAPSSPVLRERPLRGPVVVTLGWRHPRPGFRGLGVPTLAPTPERAMARELGRQPAMRVGGPGGLGTGPSD
ncbi:MAG TPA: hypothetical protein VGJ25_10020 [Gaiellaceae bacterium]|jgi:hypothetical protein